MEVAKVKFMGTDAVYNTIEVSSVVIEMNKKSLRLFSPMRILVSPSFPFTTRGQKMLSYVRAEFGQLKSWASCCKPLIIFSIQFHLHPESSQECSDTLTFASSQNCALPISEPRIQTMHNVRHGQTLAIG